jgi:hypothetical protein
MPATLEPPATPAEETKSLMAKYAADWLQKPAKAEPEAPKEEKPPEEKAPEPKVEEKKEPEAGIEESKPTEQPSDLATTLGNAVRDVGRVVSEAVKSRASEERPQTQASFKLPPEALRRQQQFETLERLFPDKYAGKSKEWEKFVEQQVQYEQNWKAEHPGKTFNPEDEEHNEFFESDPSAAIEQEHLEEARIEQRVAVERNRMEQRLKEVETRTSVIPAAQREGQVRARNVANELIGKPLTNLLNEDGTVNQAQLAELTAADPLRAPIVAATMAQAAQLTSEVKKIAHGATRMDIESNPLHFQLAKFGVEKDSIMQGVRPSEWNSKDARGRRREDWIPNVEFYSLTPSQRRGKWTFDDVDMIEAIEQELVKDSKKIITDEENRIDSLAAKRGFTKAAVGKPDATAPIKPSQNGHEHVDKPRSPSASNDPKVAGAKPADQSNAGKLQNAWAASWMGK